MISRGFITLLQKEILRFWKVAAQTITAPIVTSLLYLLVFGQAMSDKSAYANVSFLSFLIPGLVMMSILQNAFANASSSLIQSKINGSILFLLLSPISDLEVFFAYLFAAMVRGMVVGLGVFLITLWFAPLAYAAPIWIIVFAMAGSATLGTMGLIAGIWAEKYEHLATFQNFFIMPATFLSGVFYSIHTLPPMWLTVSRFNPFFYVIDGFRYGFIGQSDINPFISLAIASSFFLFIAAIAIKMLKSGYKLRH